MSSLASPPAIAPLDPPIPASILADIQGNILAGFNKDHQRFLFCRISNPARTRAWLPFVIPLLSTCEQVQTFNQQFKATRRAHRGETGMPTATWLNLAFTFRGLTELGAPGLDGFSGPFRHGMAASAAAIGDVGPSDPAHWQAPFSPALRDSVHLVLLLASDLPSELASLAAALLAGLPTAGLTCLLDQSGEARADEPGHEHFGFKDGVSQPGVRGFTPSVESGIDLVHNTPQGVPGQDLLWPGEFVLGLPRQNPDIPQPPFESPNPTPLPGDLPNPSWALHGSFLCFRKLHQDVAAFHNSVSKTAPTLGLTPEVFGAKLVGRYRSGCPLERSKTEFTFSDGKPATVNTDQGFPSAFDPTSADPSSIHTELLADNLINNFEYGNDPDGLFVPRSAHIRKAYPRDEEFSSQPPGQPLDESDTQTHRLLRRGIAYGASLTPPPVFGQPWHDDGVDRGLLFLAYQADLARQFEFVQSRWVNAPAFPEPGIAPGVPDGEDPIISQSTAGPFACPLHGTPHHLTVPHFVTTRGGEYFFQPSLSSLYILSNTAPPA